ncbi:DUF11 domain-containing protein [Actinomadura barringtoniae]|uniref:DUF11 domain-containing protein n=1 Tax=Actinomadura barringtoniae TaxID=1427535 RepID=A0A939P5U7_9ACTN|nr:DUF11 domain-containing protein [Actinomadura barringtoniae]MBO2445760.1 DUF11 domain-containing protein [Actinomadura barringtoniae]
MKGIIAGRTAIGTAALGAALLGTALPGHAEARHAAIGKVEFVYSAPEVAEAGDSVTWRWTVKNVGGESVDKVVLTHKLTPALKVKTVDEPCEAGQTSIRCEYGTLKAGEKRQGTVVAVLPPETSGTVQINGRVTWQQGTAPVATDSPAPATPKAPAADAADQAASDANQAANQASEAANAANQAADNAAQAAATPGQP